MSASRIRRFRGTAIQSAFAVIVMAGCLTVVPEVIAPTDASADECKSNVATYVVGPIGSGGLLKRSIQKYVDWDPQGGGTAAPLAESPDAVGEIPIFSKVFTAGNGLIYETTNDGKLNVYKDQTDSGGPLLKLVKTHTAPWKRFKQIWSNGPLIHVANNEGGIDRYSQSDPVNGTGAITKINMAIPPGQKQYRKSHRLTMSGPSVIPSTHSKMAPYVNGAATAAG